MFHKHIIATEFESNPNFANIAILLQRMQKLKKALLLLNMGGPNNIEEVGMFLRNMFADRNILPMNPLLRRLVGSIIIKKRLHMAEDNYRLIGGKSPLTDISTALSEKLEDAMGIPVRLAMRYVPPFADSALSEFQKFGVEELVLFAMYPHYSSTTTLSSVEDIKQRCDAMDYHPDIRVIDPYYANPTYIKIQTDLIIRTLGDEDPKSYSLLLSAHGLPISIIKAGDSYQKQVEVNAELIEEELKRRGIIFKNIKLVYQSKVGSAAWLEPNLVNVLRRAEDLKVLIFPIAFTVDNSETIFELDIENRTIARKIGYEDYRVSKCPNDSGVFKEFINKVVQDI